MVWLHEGYLKMRLPGGREASVHRYLWEQAHGLIPEGGIIHHKDEDKLNNDLANLELTQRGPHVIMHRGQPYGVPRSDTAYSREYYRQNRDYLNAQARRRYHERKSKRHELDN